MLAHFMQNVWHVRPIAAPPSGRSSQSTYIPFHLPSFAYVLEPSVAPGLSLAHRESGRVGFATPFDFN